MNELSNNPFWVPVTVPQVTATVILVFLIYLLGSVIKNIYFHPLSKFPGPKLFAATGLLNLYYVFRGTRVYEVSKLHNQYGPIVRISPWELSYVHEDAWKGIYGSHKETGQTKKDTVSAPDNISGLFANPNEEIHARLRKKLSTGFSEKALRESEIILQTYVDKLVERLEDTAGKPQDLLRQIGKTAFAITYTLTFGQPLQMSDVDIQEAIDAIGYGLLKSFAISASLNHYFLGTLYIIFIFFTTTYISTLIKVVKDGFSERDARIANEGDVYHSDFVSIISKKTGSTLSEAEVENVGADLIGAGSDTVATALSATTYLLLSNPEKHIMLKKELRTAFKSSAAINLLLLNNLPYLNAVLSESMRLIPAGAETTRRISNGTVICGEFIPTGTLVGVYHWAAGHNTSSWKDANSFIPERWLDNQDYKDDKRGVVQPFNTGPRNCIAQNLAMAELRLILAKLVWSFDLELCKESKGWEKMQIFGLTYNKRPLMVKLRSVV